MSQKENKNLEHDLLGSLLQDIDGIQYTDKKAGSNHPVQAFSAPPAFSDINYKLDFDLLQTSTFQSPDPEDQTIMEAFLKKQTKFAKSSYDLQRQPPQNYRKLSCDSGLIQYQETPHSLSFSYYDYTPLYSPTQQLLSNLERVSDWARDQNGSRTVQDIFQKQTDQRKDMVFSIIFKDSMNLMVDRFGNYVFQKIFQKGLQSHKQLITNIMWGSINSLCVHAYGCRVIQKAIEYINGKNNLQQKFMEQISPNILDLIQNQNGNHVIQKCFQVFAHNKIQQISTILKNKLDILAYHTFGCRVVQKYLQCYSQQTKCKQILATLLEQSLQLSQCQFGNYVMQHIVTKCYEQRKKVFVIFLSNILKLSTNKYASNVIEKAIQAQNSTFCEDLAEYFNVNAKDLIYLSKHQFGNYVIQSMINKISKQKKQLLRIILRENASQISKSQHGRHVLMQAQANKGK